ncbi:MAG: diacylglycerol kinase [Bacteriovorax sp.]|jgi:diacylglycerol kinase (ATP)
MKNQNFYRRLLFSLNGIRSAWKSEISFRTQTVITALVIIALIFLRPSVQWTAIFTLIIGATLASELLNTALEYMIDVLHPGLHPQIGKAKDCAAAAVLVLSLSSILIFLLFLYDKFC